MFKRQICKDNNNIQVSGDYIIRKGKQTNYNRIKTMTIDEIADLIDTERDWFINNGYIPKNKPQEKWIMCSYDKWNCTGCTKCIKRWLESEVE